MEENRETSTAPATRIKSLRDPRRARPGTPRHQIGIRGPVTWAQSSLINKSLSAIFWWRPGRPQMRLWMARPSKPESSLCWTHDEPDPGPRGSRFLFVNQSRGLSFHASSRVGQVCRAGGRNCKDGAQHAHILKKATQQVRDNPVRRLQRGRDPCV